MLDERYRPVWDPELPVRRPRRPERVQRFMYGLGRASAIIEGKMKDERPFASAEPPRRGRLSDEEKTRAAGVIYGPQGEVLSTAGA